MTHHDAVDPLEKIVAEEGIDRDFARTGKLNLASKPAHVEGLRKTHEIMSGRLGIETRLIPKGELHTEVGSYRFHGRLFDARSAGRRRLLLARPGRHEHRPDGARRRAGGKQMAEYMNGNLGANPWRDLPFRRIPGHFGPPWLLPFAGGYCTFKDLIR
ncbi:FAD-binding oxidoreductase/lyase [Streptomyces coeruleorubidus]|uniref:hypothetical protein n=1 Tax=Streptomyces coeruleorubidus TaxID=116188 RepID=UPI00369BBDFF